MLKKEETNMHQKSHCVLKKIDVVGVPTYEVRQKTMHFSQNTVFYVQKRVFQSRTKHRLLITPLNDGRQPDNIL